MKKELSMTNVSFDYLHGSSEFLNLVLNNISSCVLLLDKQMKLKAFNDSLKTIFSNKKDDDLLYKRCGEAIGCAYQVEEHKECGQTSKCATCELRLGALNSYMLDEVIYQDCISRPFFDYNNNKIIKHLRYSTRLFRFESDKYILMLIDDITDLTDLRKKCDRITDLRS